MQTIHVIPDLRGGKKLVAAAMVNLLDKKQVWCTTGAIAKEAKQPSSSVSSTLNTLRKEGIAESRGTKTAQFEWKLTESITPAVNRQKPVRQREITKKYKRKANGCAVPKNITTAERIVWHSEQIKALTEALANDLALVDLIRERK